MNPCLYSLQQKRTLPLDEMTNIEFLGERLARIEKRGDSYVIKDVRGGHTILLNDTQILEAPLKNGDEILVDHHHYVFYTDGVPQTKPTRLKTKNPMWQNQLEKLSGVAKTDFSVLILGASGSGKEVLAAEIHRLSARAKGPFVSVNCSALTETLVESELFGHVKGSFTGAIEDRKGAFEAARGGTLFLDEIGDLPYTLQAKILRALENNEIRPVGADVCTKTDVRIIAATHQQLPQKIRTREFRSDLYYRLNVVTLNPPALKERMEDFDDLLYSFARKMQVRFSHLAIQRLRKHSWPGNIRELKNVVSRASAFHAGEEIEDKHIDRLIDPQHALTNLEGNEATELPVIKEIEKQMIIKRLQANLGNQRLTAIDLNMPKSTLHDRLKLYAIDPRNFRASRLLS